MKTQRAAFGLAAGMDCIGMMGSTKIVHNLPKHEIKKEHPKGCSF
jgi:hypothetical protein